MTTDDDRIRRLLDAAAPPSRGVSPETVARQAGRVHRRRVRLTVVGAPLLTLSVIAAAVVGARGVGSGDAGPAGGVTPSPTLSTSPDALVPWVDTPAVDYVPPAASTSTTPEAVLPCSPANLATSWGPTDGSSGRTVHTLWLRNLGGSDCSFEGFPTVVASHAGRPDVTASEVGNGATGAVLAPGERARLELGTRNTCPEHAGGGGAASYYRWVELKLPHEVGSVEVSADGPDRLDLACGLTTSGFLPELGDAEPQVPGPVLADPWRDLRIGILAGLAYRESSGALVYEVLLTNKGASDLSLADRCPSYVETLVSDTTSSVVARESHQLNCEAAPVIPAGGRVRYQMKLTTFPGVAGTPFTLTWALAMPDPPQGFDLVSVIGPDPSEPTPTGGQVYDYVSPKGVRITLDDISSGERITSPWRISGTVPGTWSFEADFPVQLLNSNGRVVARGIGQLSGDWMTEDLVPFTVTLRFDPQALGSMGTLVLRKDNPTGKARLDDSVEIPVVFGD